MSTWKSRGLRGSTLEELINRTNEKYNESGLGIIQKIPTPITPINIDKTNHQITLAYFDKKSTVDYIGVVQGIPICFDAKECSGDTFSLSNIHEHQIDFMKKFETQGGISFFLVYYTHKSEIMYLRFSEILKYWTRMLEGGRKSFRYDELSQIDILTSQLTVPVHYLPALAKDIATREKE